MANDAHQTAKPLTRDDVRLICSQIWGASTIILAALESWMAIPALLLTITWMVFSLLNTDLIASKISEMRRGK